MVANRGSEHERTSRAARGSADQPVAFRRPGRRARAVRGFGRTRGARRPHRRRRRVSEGWRSGGRAAGAGESAGDRTFQTRSARVTSSCCSSAIRRASSRSPAPGQTRIRDAVANFVVAHGTFEQALAVVRARGQGLPPVWTTAHTALVGLHFARYDASTTAAFTTALGPVTVADRLKPVDRALQLAGDNWFAYSSRFGEYLTSARSSLARAADYLPAPVERTPARSDAYVLLADFYRDEGAGASALAEYDHAATFNPRRSDVHLRAAAILWRQGRRAAAIARWKQALDVLAAPAGRAAADTAPLVAALDSIGSRRLLPELREPADKMVRVYLARNGNYRADALLRAVFRAPNDPVAGTDWLIDLSRAAANQVDTARRDRESALAARPAARSCLRAHRRGQRGNRRRARRAPRRRRRRLSSKAGRCRGSDRSSTRDRRCAPRSCCALARRDAGRHDSES